MENFAEIRFTHLGRLYTVEECRNDYCDDADFNNAIQCRIASLEDSGATIICVDRV